MLNTSGYDVFCLFFGCLFFAALIIATTIDAHIQICLLKKRYDESTGRMRWSMASKMRCQCDRVMTSLVDNTRYCPKLPEEAMWFTDNQDELKQPANWTSDKLDELLERKIFCGQLSVILKRYHFVNRRYFEHHSHPGGGLR